MHKILLWLFSHRFLAIGRWDFRCLLLRFKNALQQKIRAQRFSREWFDELDRRFIHAARLFTHDRSPFDRIIPFERLRGRKVLEIGCGMGLHAELISQCGGDLTTIDLAETSVIATQTRAELKNLKYVVRQWMPANWSFQISRSTLFGRGELFITLRILDGSFAKFIGF